MDKLPKSFYENNTIDVAQKLLGKQLVVMHDGTMKKGIIVETEAYKGVEDLACHASWRRRETCEVLWGEAGRAYVYLTYGIHYMLNIVTEKEEYPSAVLIRALEPVSGITLGTNGPGRLTKAMGITKELNNTPLDGEQMYVCNTNIIVQDGEIVKTTRIGIDYAKEWKDMPWRFYIKGNPYISKK